LYIAASNLLPQAHTKEFSRKSILLTIIGVACMIVITQFI
jgi:zinc transporter ZupT